MPDVPVVALTVRSERHVRSWHALMDIAPLLPQGSWTIVGGSMVYLHCAERGMASPRETHDVDAMLDVRAHPHILTDFTGRLKEIGFDAAGESFMGHQHRWSDGYGSVDVLIPNGVGERAAKRTGIGGGTTLQSPGGLQALARSEPVDVLVGGREARLWRPSLLGALVGKAAALSITVDPNSRRHLVDFVTLLGLVRAREDFASLNPRDRHHLERAVRAIGTSIDRFGVADAELGLAKIMAVLTGRA